MTKPIITLIQETDEKIKEINSELKYLTCEYLLNKISININPYKRTNLIEKNMQIYNDIKFCETALIALFEERKILVETIDYFENKINLI